MAKDKIEGTAPDRTELSWVQFRTPAWPQRTAYQGEMLIQAGVAQFQFTRLFLGDFRGIPVVFIESDKAVEPARVPIENVAAFGEKS